MNYLRYSLACAAILILGCSASMAVSDGTVSITIGSQTPLEDLLSGGDIHIDTPASVFRPEGFTIYEKGQTRPAFGIEFDFGPEDTPVKMLVGGRYTPSSEDLIHWDKSAIQNSVGSLGDDDMLNVLEAAETSLMELYAGILVRPTGRPKFNPFIGGGVTYVNIDSESIWMSENPNIPGLQKSEYDERTLAGYINGGVRWRFGEKFQLGVAGRFLILSNVQAFEFRTKGDVDYFEVGGIASWEW